MVYCEIGVLINIPYRPCTEQSSGCLPFRVNSKSDQLLSSPHLQSSQIFPHHSLHSISTGYQSAAGFNTKWLSSASTLSLVQLLCTFLSCFISILPLNLFTQPQILRSSVTVVLGFAGGPGGELLSMPWACDLELSSSLSVTCQTFF